jgi:hypothetical protein
MGLTSYRSVGVRLRGRTQTSALVSRLRMDRGSRSRISQLSLIGGFWPRLHVAAGLAFHRGRLQIPTTKYAPGCLRVYHASVRNAPVVWAEFHFHLDRRLPFGSPVTSSTGWTTPAGLPLLSNRSMKPSARMRSFSARADCFFFYRQSAAPSLIPTPPSSMDLSFRPRAQRRGRACPERKSKGTCIFPTA